MRWRLSLVIPRLPRASQTPSPCAHGRPHLIVAGTEILVSPVLTPNTSSVTAYLPRGNWLHVWSGQEMHSGWSTVDAPLGYPGV